MAEWAWHHPGSGIQVSLPATPGDEHAQLRALARAGAPWAQTALGHALARGRHGAPDPAEAATWWLRAAARDDRLAQANLVDAFALGRGVPQNDVLAYGFWCLANGVAPGATVKAYPFAAKLTAAEIAEAGRQVARWRAAHDDLPPDPPTPPAAGPPPAAAPGPAP
jgi:hypothetical protein